MTAGTSVSSLICDQVTDVTAADFRCYDSENLGTAQTISVAAGSQLGFQSNRVISHKGTLPFMLIFNVNSTMLITKYVGNCQVL